MKTKDLMVCCLISVLCPLFAMVCFMVSLCEVGTVLFLAGIPPTAAVVVECCRRAFKFISECKKGGEE